MEMKRIALFVLMLMIVMFVVPALAESSDGLFASNQPVIDSPEWITALPAAQGAEQLFVVAGIGMDKTTAYISMHQKDDNGDWKQILSTPGFVEMIDANRCLGAAFLMVRIQTQAVLANKAGCG